MLLVRLTAPALAFVLALTLTAAGAVPRGGMLDGFTIGHLPASTEGASTSDFTYEWGEVAFNSRVWEKRLEDGAARVVLQVLVMRGDRLADLDTTSAFLTEYHERAADRALTEFDNAGAPGLHGNAEAFWVPETGVAVEVRDPFGLVGPDELMATARGIAASPA
ncbi:hypothetical protein GCM10007147_37350 [Nocardiopsis kunsanensis]|uniref:Uncharacterized protein n=1 Tax=Nocardiopsis kunsanensis TaxID=141693 RepID=A0A919CK46_9ACTN|nr:hypothetical protein [Nocardiopsis kunsanensis]GHD33082.1 hypothetical protein GCM10007147_37350 [Nocardiopsis kunsanensis]